MFFDKLYKSSAIELDDFLRFKALLCFVKYTNLSFELLEDAISASPKIIRSVRNNKHPIIMKKIL